MGGKGEHGSKGGIGSKGTQQVENPATDEDQENKKTMDERGEREKRHWEDVRKLLEMWRRKKWNSR